MRRSRARSRRAAAPRRAAVRLTAISREALPFVGRAGQRAALLERRDALQVALDVLGLERRRIVCAEPCVGDERAQVGERRVELGVCVIQRDAQRADARRGAALRVHQRRARTGGCGGREHRDLTPFGQVGSAVADRRRDGATRAHPPWAGAHGSCSMGAPASGVRRVDVSGVKPRRGALVGVGPAALHRLAAWGSRQRALVGSRAPGLRGELPSCRRGAPEPRSARAPGVRRARAAGAWRARSACWSSSGSRPRARRSRGSCSRAPAAGESAAGAAGSVRRGPGGRAVGELVGAWAERPAQPPLARRS